MNLVHIGWDRDGVQLYTGADQAGGGIAPVPRGVRLGRLSFSRGLDEIVEARVHERSQP